MNAIQYLFFCIGILSTLLFIDHFFFKPGRERRRKYREKILRDHYKSLHQKESEPFKSNDDGLFIKQHDQ